MKFLIFIVLIFATYGHATSADVATKAQALRDQFAEKLQGSSATAEDIKNIAEQSENLLAELKISGGSGLSSQEQAQALADLLTLKYAVHNTALNEGLVLKNNSRQPILIDQAARIAFEGRLKENFAIPVFNNLNNKFSKNTWRGHVTYPYAGLNLATPAIDSSTEILTETVTGEFSVDQSNTLALCHSTSGVSACSGSDVTYTFKRPADISKMKAIVISVYPGMKRGFCWQTAPLNLPDETIGTIGAKLPDCYSEVGQWDQFEESNFKDTHARYLRIVSNFVAHIKSQHPNIPIFLQGNSFGGFFVSSYALLQSLGIGTENFNMMYKPFVQTAFTEQFPDNQITPIDGIISYSGAVNYVNKIINYQWQKFLTTPAFYHWNFDDERISFKENLETVFPPASDPYNKFVTLSINRRGAQDSLADVTITPDLNDLQRLYNLSNNIADAGIIRGHFNENNPDLDRHVVHFIHHAQEMVESPLHQARQKRQFDVYRAAIGDNSTINQQDIQQFLSNLRRTQQELEAIPLDQHRAIPEPENDIIEKHMRGIRGNIRLDDLKEICVNFAAQLADDEKTKFIDYLDEVKMKTTYYSSTCNFYSGEQKIEYIFSCLFILKPAYSINDVFERIEKFPGFMDFNPQQIFEQRKAYHDRLMQHVTTKGLWQGAFERLTQDPTFKEKIRTNILQKDVRKARRAELQKTNPFLVEKIATPYDQRLAEFNKAPRLTENYSGYTDSIIELLADPTKVSLTRYANLHEKKAIMQAVMAIEILNVHKNDESQNIKDKFISAYQNSPYNTQSYNHFMIIYKTALLSMILSNKWKWQEVNDYYDQLERLSGINKDTFDRWFNEVYRHHKDGFDKLGQR